MSKRKWSENYVAFGFTKNILKDGTEKAQCILCDQVLTKSSLKPSEPKIHSATHCGSAAYGIEALKTKRARYDQKGTLPQLHKTTTTMQKPMLMASYKAAYLIAKSKKSTQHWRELYQTLPRGDSRYSVRKRSSEETK